MENEVKLWKTYAMLSGKESTADMSVKRLWVRRVQR
jgi:hypothetical protein